MPLSAKSRPGCGMPRRDFATNAVADRPAGSRVAVDRPGLKELTLRVELCLPQSLISRALWRVDVVGPRPAS
jgi:hypothetical protein